MSISETIRTNMVQGKATRIDSPMGEVYVIPSTVFADELTQFVLVVLDGYGCLKLDTQNRINPFLFIHAGFPPHVATMIAGELAAVFGREQPPSMKALAAPTGRMKEDMDLWLSQDVHE